MANQTIQLLCKGFEKPETKKTQFWLLIDPDKCSDAGKIAQSATESGVDAILVGSSFLLSNPPEKTIEQIKKRSALPVLLFPGGSAHVSTNCDAMLFLTLLSSRNPRWLIDEQVLAAADVFRNQIPVIPTAYLLIESGALTSVGFFSSSPPIPREKPSIAVAHALAAKYMGMHAVYLEAGSGAELPVPVDTIKKTSQATDLFTIVGGGIRTPQQAAERATFADAIVVGNFFENETNLPLLKSFAYAIHSARS